MKYHTEAERIEGRKAVSRRWRQSEKGRISQKFRMLRYRYKLQKLTKPQWLELFRKQNGLCAICGASHLEAFKGLHLDHNHKSGIIRGLLCNRCNQELGLFEKYGQDNETTRRFKAYLERYSK